MIKATALDGIKLVDENYIATDGETEAALEQAFQQGSQGWGVRRDQGVLLRLARDLKIALALAQDTTETQNKLKGLQLENGRLKKKIVVMEGLHAAMDREIAELKRQLDDAEDELNG